MEEKYEEGGMRRRERKTRRNREKKRRSTRRMGQGGGRGKYGEIKRTGGGWDKVDEKRGKDQVE